MKFLDKILDDLEHKSKKGGPLHKIRPILEAQDTFIRLGNWRTTKGAHIRDAALIKRMMSFVIVALFPAICFGVYNVGHEKLMALGIEPTLQTSVLQGLIYFIPLFIVSYAVGGLWELVFALVRGHDINEGFLVTGMLFPLILPPTLPLWQAALGISFGVVIGKEIFGGTGMNILNPALTARAFLFFAYPAQISGDKVWVAVDAAKDKLIDGFTGATPLGMAMTTPVKDDVIKVLNEHGYTLKNMFLGFIPGSIAETSTLAVLIGAVILLITGVGSWRIMVSMVAGGIVAALFCNVIAGPESSGLLALPWYYHLSMGGFAFGTVFMATDPVSATDTNLGKYIYGGLTGFLAIIIRALNPAYPEGVMLAILFMNIFSPLIDYYIVGANVKRRLKRA